MEKPREPLQGIRRSHDPFITNGPRFMKAASRLIFRERSPAANFTPLSRDKPRICARFNPSSLSPHPPFEPTIFKAGKQLEGEGKKKNRKREKIVEGVRNI